MYSIDKTTQNIQAVFDKGLHKSITAYEEEEKQFEVEMAGISPCRNKAFYLVSDEDKNIIRVMNKNETILISYWNESYTEWNSMFILDKNLEDHQENSSFSGMTIDFLLDQINEITQKFILNHTANK